MGSLDPSTLGDPNRLSELLGEDAFTPEDTPEQAAALSRLETLLALVEGWVDDVVSLAGDARLPASVALAETMRRRRAAGGPAEKTFASLIGLELRPRALREAAQVWRLLREASGLSARDALWNHPDLLPTHDDLADPEAFVQRSSAGSDLEADLADLNAELEAMSDDSGDDSPGHDSPGDDSPGDDDRT
jgi:putative hydrolase